MQIQQAIDIRAPASLVYEVVSTPERLPEWNASAVAGRRVPPDQPVGPGTRAVFVGKVLGQTLESETEVVGFEPPHWFATRAVRGPRIHTSFRLDSAADGTRIQATIEGDPPGGKLGALVAEPILRADLGRSLEQLKRLCESEAARRASDEPAEGGDPACWQALQPDARSPSE